MTGGIRQSLFLLRFPLPKVVDDHIGVNQLLLFDLELLVALFSHPLCYSQLPFRLGKLDYAPFVLLPEVVHHALVGALLLFPLPD